MLLPAHRIGDLSVGCCPIPGHGCYIGISITGSRNTMTEGKPNQIVTSLEITTCGAIGMAIQGSSTVMINNLPAHRLAELRVTNHGSIDITITAASRTMFGG